MCRILTYTSLYIYVYINSSNTRDCLHGQHVDKTQIVVGGMVVKSTQVVACVHFISMVVYNQTNNRYRYNIFRHHLNQKLHNMLQQTQHETINLKPNILIIIIRFTILSYLKSNTMTLDSKCVTVDAMLPNCRLRHVYQP